MLHAKKLLSLLLCAGLIAGPFPTEARAEEPLQTAEITAAAGDVVIDENTFPDANFRKYVRTLPGAEDDVFTEAEIAGITEISCGRGGALDSEKIADLTGIENFPNLVFLECYNNQLTKLDLRKNPKLVALYCVYNQLTEVDLSWNPALRYLNFTSNRLVKLDVSQNPALEDLVCYSNQLTELDVSQNPELEALCCGYNQLIDLDVSQNFALKHLDCGSNRLTGLVVSQNPALVHLFCGSNQLTDLDVSRNPALETLNCEYNQLTELDVSRNLVLESLGCSSNRLTRLDVSQNSALVNLFCKENQLTSLDIGKNAALEDLDCRSNQLTSLDVSHNPALANLDCYGNVRETAEARKLDLPGLERSRVHELIGGHWEAGKLSFYRDSTEITYRYDLGNGETEVFTIRLVPVYEPIRAEFVKKGWKGEQIVPLTVEPDGSMQVPKTGGRHYFWRSEDGQLAVKSKGTLTYGQLLETLGGSAPAGSVVRFRIADDRDPVTRTVTVRFFDGPAEIGTAAVEVAETASSVRAEQLKKLLPAGYDFAETAEAYPIGTDGEVRVAVMDASLVVHPVTVTFTLKGMGHLQGIQGKTMEVSVAADGSAEAPYAESFHKTKPVTWTTADGALILQSGESVTYETLRELLGGAVPGDAQITFTGTAKRR